MGVLSNVKMVTQETIYDNMKRHKNPLPFMGSLTWNDSANFNAKVADKQLRVNYEKELDMAMARFTELAKMGSYMACIRIPRVYLTKMVSKLTKKGYICFYSTTVIPGDALYCEVSVYWGNKSSRLATKDYIGISQNLVSIFCAESLAHGLTESRHQREIGRALFDPQLNSTAGERLIDNIMRLYAYYVNAKGKATTAMSFANNNVIPASQLLSALKKNFTTVNVNEAKKLIEQYKKAQDDGSPKEMYLKLINK